MLHAAHIADIRRLGYNYKTGQVYVSWMYRFAYFNFITALHCVMSCGGYTSHQKTASNGRNYKYDTGLLFLANRFVFQSLYKSNISVNILLGCSYADRYARCSSHFIQKNNHLIIITIIPA